MRNENYRKNTLCEVRRVLNDIIPQIEENIETYEFLFFRLYKKAIPAKIIQLFYASFWVVYCVLNYKGVLLLFTNVDDFIFRYLLLEIRD